MPARKLKVDISGFLQNHHEAAIWKRSFRMPIVHRDVLPYCGADSPSMGLAKRFSFTAYVLSTGAASFLHAKFYQHTKGPLIYNIDHISLLYYNNCMF